MSTKVLEGWGKYELAVRYLRTVYVWGLPGLGKTHSAIEMLNNQLQHAHVMQGDNVAACATVTTLNEDIVTQELFGHYLPGKEGFEFHYGPVARAIMSGALVINELARASGAVKDAMLSLLDGSSVAKVLLGNGETITPSEHFKVVATANSDVSELDPALQDRFEAIVHVTEPHPGVVQYLESAVRGLGKMVLDSYADGERAISVRQSLTFVKLLNAGFNRAPALQLAYNDRWSDMDAALKLRG